MKAPNSRVCRPRNLICLALVLVAPGQQARAQTTAPEPQGWHRHDGVFLRFLAGAGHTSMSTTASGIDARMAGAGYGFGFALGGAVLPNLILFGELLESAAIEPDVDVEGLPPLQAQADAGANGVGVGVGYYFGPNLYLTGTLVATRMVSIDDDGDEIGRTKVGPGLSLVAGKEWWVSANWGLGVAVQLYLARTRDRAPTFAPETPLWRIRGLNALFSATFN
jgi:hypothetical protein